MELFDDSTQAAPGDKAIYETGEIDQGKRTFDWGWIGTWFSRFGWSVS